MPKRALTTFAVCLCPFWIALTTFAWFNEVFILGVPASIGVLAGPTLVSFVLSGLFTLLNSYYLRKAEAVAKTQVEQLEKTQVELIRTLSDAAEARSGETGAHIKRVAAYSRFLAELIGLSEQECSAIKNAAPLHDIGKLAIPDAVLNKPGRLSPEEFAVMRTHAEKGRDLLTMSDQPLFHVGARIAYGHHEKWNGSGYPQGLNGESIPLEARIVALADVFDALGTKRVYKDAWPDSRIKEYIEHESGQHFDPTLSECFLRHFSKFADIRQRYS